MKKHITQAATMALAILLALCNGLYSQNFKQSGKTASELYTKKATSTLSAQGDFDKDGIKDLVIFVEQDYTETGDGNTFAFYLGNAQGGYSLFRAYNVSLSGNSKITVTDKGVVRIESPTDGNGSDVFLFRYQDGDFRLIGGKKDRHHSEHYDESYNFLTGKMIRTSGEGKGKNSATSQMQPMPKLNFGWFPLCFDMLDYLFKNEEENQDMEYQTVMGIFRVMQANQMLFWHFCDYQNPYRNPHGSNGQWLADDELLKPACYNSFSSLSIKKQNNGTYLIELSETFEDRSYEQQFNEDLSNIDDVEIPDNTEQTSFTKWTFKNGQFIQLTATEN
ncbi:MAG: hypothetical protein IJP95_07375 [Bacteroidales bacterium]|nr:hypothetical protein [Bacteroidales bacterium]